jgi:hypothetical protein
MIGLRYLIKWAGVKYLLSIILMPLFASTRYIAVVIKISVISQVTADPINP